MCAEIGRRRLAIPNTPRNHISEVAVSAPTSAIAGRSPTPSQDRVVRMRYRLGVNSFSSSLPTSRNQTWDRVRLPRGFVAPFLVDSVHEA